jgi:lipopolysaccharide export system protein LptA
MVESMLKVSLKWRFGVNKIWVLLFLMCSVLSAADSAGLDLTRIAIRCEGGMTLHEKERRAEFRGKVVVSSDAISLSCHSLDLTLSGDQSQMVLKSMHANGDVDCRYIARGITARSDRMNYHKESGLLIFSSNTMTTVVVEGSKMEAKEIELNVNSETVFVEGQSHIEIDLTKK